jgi:hypothetical protein
LDQPRAAKYEETGAILYFLVPDGNEGENIILPSDPEFAKLEKGKYEVFYIPRPELEARMNELKKK